MKNYQEMSHKNYELKKRLKEKKLCEYDSATIFCIVYSLPC